MPKKSSRKSNPKSKRIRFELHKPEAQRVSLAGSFNRWDVDKTPMKRTSKGTWQVSVSLEPGRYEYRFCVDGVWQDDPKATDKTDNPFGSQNCIRVVS